MPFPGSLPTTAGGAPSIWRLQIRADEYRSFIPHDLMWFSDKFCCERLCGGWRVPPAKIYGVRKPVPDFISWGISRTFLVSERAKDEMMRLDPEGIELLPFHKIGRRQTFAVNVLRRGDYLDLSKSDVDTVNPQYFFRSNLPPTMPPIFKCEGVSDEIFVTDQFGEMVVRAGLKGVALAGPAERPFTLILRRAELNRFPGLS